MNFFGFYKRKEEHLPVILIAVALLAVVFILSTMINTNMVAPKTVSKFGFYGEGTQESPYLIEDVEDLVLFRDLVNEGNDFNLSYFLQTDNIDLSPIENWIPIGVLRSDKYFKGHYDGGGHTISNLNCIYENENVGFFGYLAGKVSNLGIESGSIRGECVGSFASHGAPDALIFNCYNKASVHGLVRAGGLADNFAGDIVFSFNLGEVTTDTDNHAGLMSYKSRSVDYSYSTIEPLVSPVHSGSLQNSEVITPDDLTTDFLGKRYQAMQNWSFLKTEGANKMILLNETLCFVEDSKIPLDTQYFETKMMVLIIAVMLLIFMISDYKLNVRHTTSYRR